MKTDSDPILKEAVEENLKVIVKKREVSPSADGPWFPLTLRFFFS